MGARRRNTQPRRSWGAPDVVDKYHVDGFSDPGEQRAIAALEAALTSARVLDLGVGGGRTTALLRPLTERYVGVDSSPEMVTLARSRHPGTDIRCADARDLGSDYPDGGFDLVVFSFNGIDAVDHSGHGSVLTEVHRVLRPGGYLLFSSLNADGPDFDERPWRLARVPGRTAGERAARKVLAFLRGARHPRTQLASIRNYRHTHRRARDGDNWYLRPMRAHEFRFLVHFSTVGATVAMTRAAGFDVQRAWTSAGEEVGVDASYNSAAYLHYLCRKPLAASA